MKLFDRLRCQPAPQPPPPIHDDILMEECDAQGRPLNLTHAQEIAARSMRAARFPESVVQSWLACGDTDEAGGVTNR